MMRAKQMKLVLYLSQKAVSNTFIQGKKNRGECEPTNIIDIFLYYTWKKDCAIQMGCRGLKTDGPVDWCKAVNFHTVTNKPCMVKNFAPMV